MFYFQKLDIYQKAKELNVLIYEMVKHFPSEERYGLVQQLTRAAVSVPSNIAEGISRYSVNEKIRFLNYSYGSLMELACQSEISKDLGYISQDMLTKINLRINELCVMISNFVRTLKTRS